MYPNIEQFKHLHALSGIAPLSTLLSTPLLLCKQGFLKVLKVKFGEHRSFNNNN